MDEELTQREEKMLEYINVLEKSNEQLVNSMKLCVELLAVSRPASTSREEWQGILDNFRNIIKVGEEVMGIGPFIALDG